LPDFSGNPGLIIIPAQDGIQYRREENPQILILNQSLRHSFHVDRTESGKNKN
jgi:hypothetical protein